MNVRFSARAEADLGQIAEWIARDSPVRAMTFALELQDRCRALAKHPGRYPEVAGPSQRKLRRMPYRDYLIFYETQAQAVLIVRILHGSMDYGSTPKR